MNSHGSGNGSPPVLTILCDEEEGWRIEDATRSGDEIQETGQELHQEEELEALELEGPEQFQDPDEQDAPVEIDDEGEPQSRSGKGAITAIRDATGEFSEDEEIVVIDEYGNVVDSNILEQTDAQGAMKITAIRDNKGEYAPADEDYVVIDEYGNVIDSTILPRTTNSPGRKPTAINDRIPEFAQTDYHIAAPRGLLVLGDERTRPRMRVEFEKLNEYWPTFKMKGQDGKVTAVEGAFIINGTHYGIRVEIPDNYPYSIPIVYPVGWNPVGAPHRYHGGDLCLMKKSQWSATYSISLILKKAAKWVNKYLSWKVDKEWPGLSQD